MINANTRQVSLRRLLASDLGAVLALQKENLLANIDESTAKDGFIQGEFSEEQFLQINKDAAVMVAEVDGKFAGYLCSFALASLTHLSLPSYAIARFSQIQFQGKALSAWRCLFTGPICIAKAYRGKGIFAELYNYLFAQMSKPPAHFESAVALIDDANPRSLAAHIKKAGMQVVDDWSFDGRNYKTVAKLL